jgi:hypothetical protein
MPPRESAKSISSPTWQEKLNDVHYRLGILQIQEEIWNRLLTDPEREEATRLGWPDRAVSFTKLWMDIRGISKTRAVIELGRGVGLLSEADREWLLQEIGESSDAVKSRRPKNKSRPHWDSERGELMLGDAIIRRVRGRTVATRIVAILDEFEKRGWPQRIERPDSICDGQMLRESVQSLNRRLTRIHFEADGTGRGIRWKQG